MRRRDISFEVGDFVMARIRAERLSKYSHKRLHAQAMEPYQITRKLGSDTDNLGISHIFNVEDLTLHRGTFEPPSLTFGASTST